MNRVRDPRTRPTVSEAIAKKKNNSPRPVNESSVGPYVRASLGFTPPAVRSSGGDAWHAQARPYRDFSAARCRHQGRSRGLGFPVRCASDQVNGGCRGLGSPADSCCVCTEGRKPPPVFDSGWTRASCRQINSFMLDRNTGQCLDPTSFHHLCTL
jgi:hypothetical protein